MASEDMALLIRTLRSASGMSQNEFADAAGLSKSTIAKIEIGAVLPSAATMQRIRQALADMNIEFEAFDDGQFSMRKVA